MLNTTERLMNSLFDPEFNIFPIARPQGQDQAPAFSYKNDDGKLACSIDLPGTSPDDVKVTFAEGAITIAGRRGEKEFSYRMTVHNSYDLETTKARMKDGVLTLSVDQIVKPEPKRIRIETK